MDLGLSSKVALVTASSRGLGRAVALRLAQEGADVALCARGLSDLRATAAEIRRETSRSVLAIQADVSDFNQAHELVNQSIQELGGLDILVNNAGIIRDNLIMRMPENDWDDVLTTNLKSTFNCSKAAVRHMMRKRYGRIINITSIAGQMGNPGQVNYSASKAGQIGLTKALARELASRKITVNAIAPGYVMTDINVNLPEEAMEFILNLTPMGRTGTVEEIAYAVAFLASDQASYITGQVLAVDGGMAMM